MKLPIEAGQTPIWKDYAFWTTLLLAGIACLWPFHLGHLERAYLADDFYYYAQVAKNFAETGRSTFDGIHLTNGYHPLWLLILTVYWKVAGSAGFFVLVNLTIVSATALVFGEVRRVLRTAGLSSAAAGLGSLWASLFFLYFSRTGMEVDLTVPLMLWLFLRWQARTTAPDRKTAATDGLLGTAIILSRLDSVLLLGWLGLVYLVWGEAERRERFRYLVSAAIWLWPVALYAVSNRFWFGTFGTVSGLSKHMRFSHVPSRLALASMFNLGPGVMLFVITSVLLAVTALALLTFSTTLYLRRNAVAVLLAVMLYPFGYFLLLSTSSGWRIFTWYDYPMVFSSVAAMIALHATLGSKFPSSSKLRMAWTGMAVLLVVGYAKGLNQAPQTIYQDALQLHAFAQTHPGTYAMGDRAGFTGFFLGEPLIQLEGLMMDYPFLAKIRNQEPLLKVLHEYGVRYYITVDHHSANPGCFEAVEPSRSDEYSPKLRGTICAAPVLRTNADGYTVFDLTHEATR